MSKKPPRPDKYGRIWPTEWNDRELCPTCGQPDNCGDCNHLPLTKKQAVELGGRAGLKKLFHRRYYDKKDRPDLRALAVCNNINGAICGPEKLTSNKDKVTCGRCLRIMWSDALPRRAFSPAMLRLITRTNLHSKPQKQKRTS
jgi:hypothetical protein